MALRESTACAYDQVARKRHGDMLSKAVPFRHFHNYVKKCLIQDAMNTVRQSFGSGRVTVLDLASGRGGDVGKWLHTRSPAVLHPLSTGESAEKQLTTGRYLCYDISPVSIDEAQTRFSDMGGANMCEGHFTVADCFSEPFLTTDLRQLPAQFGAIHVVSIQFAYHYACSSTERIRLLMETISAVLAPGGVFIATTVDCDVLSARVRDGCLSNSLYQLELAQPPQWESGSTDGHRLAVGTKYHFKLEGFVDCPEYVVPLPFVRACAAECGLQEVGTSSKPFDDFLRVYSSSYKLNKGNALSEAEKELTSLYRSMFFVKRS